MCRIIVVLIRILGVDVWNFLGGLAGGLGSIFGGLMNTSSAQSINSANLANQVMLANTAVRTRVADANKAGINPLAALGVSSPGFVGATATDPGAGVAAAGQDISRALMAMKDRAEKEDDLQKALIQAQIDRENASTTGQLLLNSRLARALASPGNGPGFREVFGPRRDDVTGPATQNVAGAEGPITIPSDIASQGTMTGAAWPMSWLMGIRSALSNVDTGVPPMFTRPDVRRAVSNLSISDLGAGSP